MEKRGRTGREGLPRRARSVVAGLAAWCARLVGLAVVVLLVVGIGAGVRTPDRDAPVYSASQEAQLSAEERFRSLASSARELSATEPALTDLLLSTASDLDRQADAVALPRPPESAAAPRFPDSPDSPGTSEVPALPPGPEPAEATPEDAAAGATTDADHPPVDAPRFLSLLRESALGSLADAVDADPGPARVLAAAGANQWQRTLSLAAALGVASDLPAPDAAALTALDDASGPFSPTTPGGTAGPMNEPVTEPIPTPASGSTSGTGEPTPSPVPGSDCAGSPLGPDTDRQALTNARAAAEQAHYGYEVAAALLPDRDAPLRRAAEHESAARLAAERLTALCADPPPVPAGFVLTAAFRSDPVGELRRLEEQHVDLYAGYVATVGRDARAWASISLVAAVLRSVESGAPLEALPGIDAESLPADVAPGVSDDAGSPSPVPGQDDDAEEERRDGD